jgi:hypothetical protein
MLLPLPTNPIAAVYVIACPMGITTVWRSININNDGCVVPKFM